MSRRQLESSGTVDRTTGYKRLYYNGKYRGVHRLVVEMAIGRPLGKNEIVHHINGDKEDNRLENLRVIGCGEHASMHMIKYPVIKGTKKECGRCHRVKPLAEFYTRRSMLGYFTCCKSCSKDMRGEWITKTGYKYTRKGPVYTKGRVTK